MKVTTVDPISGNDVSDVNDAPFVIEGSGEDALKIYFESEANRSSYLDIEAKTPEAVLLDIYNRTTGDAQEM